MLREILERIDERLAALGLSESRAAKTAGLSDSAIRDMRRALKAGKEDAGVSTRTLTALAPVLECSSEWLLTGRDPAGAGPVDIPVMGYVGAGAEVEPDFEQVPPDGLFQITVPFPMPADMIAYQVRGDSMLPQFHDGMIIVVFKEQRRSTDSFLGEEAVVRTADGRRFVKTVERSGDGGYTLRSWNAKPIERVSLDWVGEIFTYLPATSLKRESRRVEKQGGLQGQLKLRAG